MSREINTIEAFEQFKESVNNEYQSGTDKLLIHSDNVKEIQRLKASNEKILEDVLNIFQTKLEEAKQDKTKREAIIATFEVLSFQFSDTEKYHKDTLKVFNTFKRYYTSKVFIPSSKINYKAIQLSQKLLKHVPYKAINDAFSGKFDISSLEAFSSAINTLEKSFKSLSSADKLALIEDINCKYVVLKNDKLVLDKAHFQDMYNTNLSSVLQVLKLRDTLNITYIEAQTI